MIYQLIERLANHIAVFSIQTSNEDLIPIPLKSTLRNHTHTFQCPAAPVQAFVQPVEPLEVPSVAAFSYAWLVKPSRIDFHTETRISLDTRGAIHRLGGAALSPVAMLELHNLEMTSVCGLVHRCRCVALGGILVEPCDDSQVASQAGDVHCLSCERHVLPMEPLEHLCGWTSPQRGPVGKI